MNKEDLKVRTKKFAHACVKVALSLPNDKLGQHIQGQLIRCSTSVAANYRATCLAQSKRSFSSKISIVIEESDESYFWLEFIKDEGLLGENVLTPLMQEAKELTSIFISSRITVNKSISKRGIE